MGQCAETGEPLFPINDTGVTTYSNNNDILEACATASTQAQDCHHGRDNNSEIIKQGFGIAGFDFNKLDSNGVSLPLDADKWDCVVDHTTGLTWEIKLKNNEQSPRYYRHTYSWYQESLLHYSTPDNGACDESAICDTQFYLAKLNESNLCGKSNWRLPTKSELQNIVNYGSLQPSIDINLFPNTVSEFYWTSTIDSDDEGSVWAVDFNVGRVAGSASNGGRYIRAVSRPTNVSEFELDLSLENSFTDTHRIEVAPLQRCNPDSQISTPTSRFKQTDANDIYDAFTGLVWKRCIEGTTGDFCENGSPLFLSWDEAQQHAAIENTSDALNYDAWRIPNIKELQSLIENQCEEPALNPFIFPNLPMEHVWSSTPHPSTLAVGYYIQYQNGIIFYEDGRALKSVHLVKNHSGMDM